LCTRFFDFFNFVSDFFIFFFFTFLVIFYVIFFIIIFVIFDFFFVRACTSLRKMMFCYNLRR